MRALAMGAAASYPSLFAILFLTLSVLIYLLVKPLIDDVRTGIAESVHLSKDFVKEVGNYLSDYELSSHDQVQYTQVWFKLRAQDLDKSNVIIASCHHSGFDNALEEFIKAQFNDLMQNDVVYTDGLYERKFYEKGNG